MAMTSLTSTTQKPAASELFFNNQSVSLCLLVNRRAKTVRIIDFRAGATLAKRNFVFAAARREGIEKVFTLTESSEVTDWVRLGFRREACIPGFYRRSDAWILGARIADVGVDRADDDDDLEELSESAPATALAEKTINKGKRLAKSVTTVAVKVAPARPAEIKRAMMLAEKAERAVTGFEGFSRDGVRTHYSVTAKGIECMVCVETQASFQHAFLEILTAPRTEGECHAWTSGLAAIHDVLREQDVLNAFSMSPADDETFAAAFLSAGYRKTGVLASHLVVGGQRKDAILWSRSLIEN